MCVCEREREFGRISLCVIEMFFHYSRVESQEDSYCGNRVCANARTHRDFHVKIVQLQ